MEKTTRIQLKLTPEQVAQLKAIRDWFKESRNTKVRLGGSPPTSSSTPNRKD